jgi:uncharacterized membrane protein (DUF485 family)
MMSAIVRSGSLVRGAALLGRVLRSAFGGFCTVWFMAHGAYPMPGAMPRAVSPCWFRVMVRSGPGPNIRSNRATPRACSSHPGDDMENDLAKRISALPKYQELKRKRSSFGWWLTLAMMVVYYGFILLVAFNKQFLSQRLGDGVMTMGIPIGFGVIVFTIVITAIYVKRANGEFDDLNDAVAKAVLK